MAELYHLSIAEARVLLDSGEISSEQLVQAYLDRIGAVETEVRGVSDNHRRAGAGAGACRRRRPQGWASCIAAAWHSPGDQGRDLDQRRDDDLRLEDARTLCAAVRRDRDEPAACGGAR